jgi:hypothetical protein
MIRVRNLRIALASIVLGATGGAENTFRLVGTSRKFSGPT